ncbi:MAG TPA: ATP-binding protein [Thermoanaerobaculia bacterium]|nr:ATP-binding protein [Thermoanaerobaculia bacterium]
MAPVARVCLTGPESTGKSELAAELARHYGWDLVPEFAREYALQNRGELTFDDVEPIARGEIANLERAGRQAILDTDLLSTVVYSRYYYGGCPEWIIEEARRRRADLYLLMDTDVPWNDDPARDAGGGAREDLFDAFRASLDEFETRWAIVSGGWEERRRKALEAISA